MGVSSPPRGLADLPLRKDAGVPPPPSSEMRRMALAEAARVFVRKPRPVEIASLDIYGEFTGMRAKLPGHPLFDACVSAFARGTLLRTPNGEIAIEDLQPGDTLQTAPGDKARVLWIGSTLFSPSDDDDDDETRGGLTRVMPDAFGMGRPASHVTFGPAARILQTPADLRGQIGGASLLTPVSRFSDGVQVIDVTPPTPVTLFHIVLDRHAVIRAGGLEVESFHPGSHALRDMHSTMRDQFLSLFPHIKTPADFGPLVHPRAPEIR